MDPKHKYRITTCQSCNKKYSNNKNLKWYVNLKNNKIECICDTCYVGGVNGK